MEVAAVAAVLVELVEPVPQIHREVPTVVRGVCFAEAPAALESTTASRQGVPSTTEAEVEVVQTQTQQLAALRHLVV